MIKYLQAAELLKEVGLDNSEFLERAKFLETVRVAIERKDVGFRGDWVSCNHINSDLHPKKWAALLGTMGYVLHPTMAVTGRTSHPVSIGSGRSWLRLFVKQGSPAEKIAAQKEAVYAFKQRQLSP